MGEVGTKFIFENERVKVWEFSLGPGESIDTHSAKNIGPGRYHEVLVELKAPRS